MFHGKHSGVIPPSVSEEFLLSSDQVGQLAEYVSLLDLFARPTGLVGFSARFDAENIVRSLLFTKLFEPGVSLVDVGTGAGLPGVPIAIARGGVKLVDSRRKSVGFLEKVVRELDLDAVVVGSRAEAYAQTAPEGAEVVVARALAPPREAARLCAPLCKPGGWVILASKSTGVGGGLAEKDFREYGLGDLKVIKLQGPLDICQTMLMMTKLAVSP